MDEDITDASIDWEDVDYEGISEFLNRKGAVELLAFLDGFGYRFDEIDDALDVSRAYINDRRDEALNLNLIYPTQQDREGTIRRAWALSTLGMIIVYRMRLFGLREKHYNLLKARREYQEHKDKFHEWSDNPDNIKEFTTEAFEDKDLDKDSEFSMDIKVVTSKPDHDPLDR